MENKIIELRNWFRMNGEMDFERSGKKEDPGKFITYKCADIESIFAGALENVSTSEKDLRVCEVSGSVFRLQNKMCVTCQYAQFGKSHSPCSLCFKKSHYSKSLNYD